MRYSKEMDEWIIKSADAMVYRNQKHFTDLFNAVHGTNVSVSALHNHLFRTLGGVTVKTKHTVDHYTKEQNQWIIENYQYYGNDFVSMANDFNAKFGTDYSNCRLAKHCERRLKLHIPKRKNEAFNKGQFKKGGKSYSTSKQLPVGTIRMYHSGTSDIPYIKVKLCEGDSGSISDNGHNLRKPWWIPLKDKVWQDTYGDIPEGYTVVNLDRDKSNCNLDNLTLIDSRGVAIMASHKWWSENRNFTGTAVQWCNLHLTAKDNGVYEKM